MLQVKELSDKRMSKKEIEEKLNMKGFVISKIQGQLKNFTHKSIREALEKAIEMSAKKCTEMQDKLRFTVQEIQNEVETETRI